MASRWRLAPWWTTRLFRFASRSASRSSGLLGAIDPIRNPRNPRRLKEYAFLFGVTGAASVYGLLHHAATYSFSHDYFRVIKGVRAASFFPQVAKLALMAGWTAGLVVGLVLLVANNPSRRMPQLPYSRLALHLLWPLLASPFLASVLGVAALLRPDPWVHGLSIDAAASRDPSEIGAVWAIHLGT